MKVSISVSVIRYAYYYFCELLTDILTMPTCPRLATYKRLQYLFDHGISGLNWYAEASENIREAAIILDVPSDYLAGLLAVFSPRCSVKRSIRHTLRFIKDRSFNRDCISSTRIAVKHFCGTGEIRGPKTGPFAKAIQGDGQAIVLDTWMAKAFGVDEHKLRSLYISRPIERKVKTLALNNNVEPADCQAAIWCGICLEHRVTPVYLDVLAEIN